MDGTLKSRKGINVPGINLGQSLVTDKDRSMIDFAKNIGVDYIGISFVESREHIEAIRRLIDAPTPKIVAKVENSGGIKHLIEIVDAADVIMIDRGDLAVETSINHVALYQKQILSAASRAGKPTIVATEMLHSMIENPLPTKAEVSDITNAVLDGASAVMLSGETAVGRYPVEAVSRISNIASLAAAQLAAPEISKIEHPQNDIRLAIRALAEALPISKLVVLSQTGYSVRIAAMSGTGLPVIAVGSDPFLTRGWNLLPGVDSITSDVFSVSSLSDENRIVQALIEKDLIDEKDYVVLVSAQQDSENLSGNLLRTLNIKTWLQQHAFNKTDSEVA